MSERALDLADGNEVFVNVDVYNIRYGEDTIVFPLYEAVFAEGEEGEIILWKGGKYATYHEWHEPVGPCDDDYYNSHCPVTNVSQFVEEISSDLPRDEREDFQIFLWG